jgi:MerR family transcriptional regulator, thiopeptide resistance regulator
MTVTALARTAGLSRGTVLYYESIGLLRRAKRSQSNYRIYGENDAQRLRQICVFRAAGLTLADIRAALDRPADDFAAILSRRMTRIGQEIDRLRGQQRAIARMLQETGRPGRRVMLSKEKWTKVMRDSGFTDEDMHRWHRQFEKDAPEDHEEFLKFLRIPDDEVRRIRQWSREGSERT